MSCSGHDLELENVLYAPACTLPEEELRPLEATHAVPPPKIDASMLPDGRVVVRLTNVGAAPLTLVFGDHSAVETFPVRAHPKARPNVKLSLVGAQADFPPAGEGLGVGWHYARIVLDPGGSVSVRLTIDRRVQEQDYAGCPPNAKCAPNVRIGGPIGSGSYVLHVGLPLHVPRLADDGADVEWVVP